VEALLLQGLLHYVPVEAFVVRLFKPSAVLPPVAIGFALPFAAIGLPPRAITLAPFVLAAAGFFAVRAGFAAVLPVITFLVDI
jgi:hypothetical protein